MPFNIPFPLVAIAAQTEIPPKTEKNGIFSQLHLIVPVGTRRWKWTGGGAFLSQGQRGGAGNHTLLIGIYHPFNRGRTLHELFQHIIRLQVPVTTIIMV